MGVIVHPAAGGRSFGAPARPKGMGLFARLAPLVLLAACSHAEGTPSDLRAELAAHRAVQIERDGVDDLVEATVKNDNAIAIADVKDGPMLDWILGSGLTQEELARIQLPAPVLMPQPAAGAMPEAQMIATVRAHVAEVEAELRAPAKEAKSLDLAVARYEKAKRKS